MRFITGAIVALSMAAPGAALAGPIANAQGWTGFYVGGHVGGLLPEIDGFFDTADSADRIDILSNTEEWAFSGGGQIGYDYQAPGMGGVVIGVVLDGSWVAGDGKTTDIDSDFTVGLNWLASARFRAGYPVADIMPYVTVGAAMADINLEHNFTFFDCPACNFDKSDTDVGYVAGFGMDWAVTPTVTVGAEALWYSFDYSQDLSGYGDDADPGDVINFDKMLHFRLTANYRF